MPRTGSRLNILLLLFAALLMRAVMPAGYMPERATDGTISIALCNSEGVLRIPLKDAGHQEDSEHRSAPPCAFAGMAGPATPPPDSPQIVLPDAAQIHFAALFEQAPDRPTPRVLPPARAPPVPV